MVLSLVAATCMLPTQVKPADNFLQGVWLVEPTGVVLVFEAGKRGRFMLNDRFACLHNAELTQSGTYLVYWTTSASPIRGIALSDEKKPSSPIKLYFKSGGEANRPRELSDKATPDFEKAPLMSWPYEPLEHGCFRVAVDHYANDGYPKRLKTAFIRGGGDKTPSDRTIWVGDLDIILFSGSYRNPKGAVLQLAITGRGVTGTFTNQGVKLTIDGEISYSGTLAALRFTNPANNAKVGEGYVQWNPTPGFVSRLTKNSYVPSDRVFVSLGFPDRRDLNVHEDFTRDQ